MSTLREVLIAAGAHESDAGQWTIWEDDVPKLRAALAQPEIAFSDDESGSTVQREDIDEALFIVKSYGPWSAGFNDEFRRMIVLADEVLRLRHLYELAVLGRAGQVTHELDVTPPTTEGKP